MLLQHFQISLAYIPTDNIKKEIKSGLKLTVFLEFMDL